MNSHFRDRLKRGDLCIGTFLTLSCPEIAELCAEAGFDWVFIDLEHTPLDVRDVQTMIPRLGNECGCLVRVSSREEGSIKKVLDTGVDGIVVPHIETRGETSDVVRQCLYPPDGNRGVGISRAQKYGLGFGDYVEHANDRILVIPQVESITGVRNIEDIARVPGISAVFVGPYDLSGSIGMLGRVESPEVQQSINRVGCACYGAGIPAGIFGVDVEAVEPYIEQGFTLIGLGMDTLFLGRSFCHALERLRGPSS